MIISHCNSGDKVLHRGLHRVVGQENKCHLTKLESYKVEISEKGEEWHLTKKRVCTKTCSLSIFKPFKIFIQY